MEKPLPDQYTSNSSLPFKMNPEVTASQKRTRPWLKNSSEEFFRDHTQFPQIVNNNRVTLTRNIDLSKLWDDLRQLDVVDDIDQARIQKDKIMPDQVAALLDLLQKKPMWKFHGFLKALCDSGQDYIVRSLGLDAETYQDNDDTPACTPLQWIARTNQSEAAQEGKPQLPPEVQKGIADHRDYYCRTLMKGHLFDIEEFDLPYDMENCYIEIVATSDEQLVNPKSIHPDKAMSTDPGKPGLKSAVLQGPPGAGKSSFIRRYAYKWSLPNGGKETEEQKQWDLVVVLPVSILRLSQGKSQEEHIFEAIKHNLFGSDQEVEAIMNHIKTKKMKVLIIPDGLDECRSDTTMKMLLCLVEKCNGNALPFSVFVTCRSGLCKIKQSLFDRRMNIEGFTVDQGIEYVEKYYAKIRKPDDDNILDYISNSRGKLGHILKNPLRTHILSVVTADGTLKLKKGQSLSLKELLGAMEESMKKRQIEKGKKAAENPHENLHEEDDIKVQTINFYKLSLYSLLKDIRMFDDNLLQKFSIWNTSPYFSFLKRSARSRKWHFTHEMWHEYFATCGLQLLPDFMIHICSRSDFRNTLRILFSALGENLDNADLLADMLKATVLLQCNKLKEIYGITEEVYSLTQDMDPIQKLLPEEKQNMDQRTCTSTMLSNAITCCFRCQTPISDERDSKVAKLWKDIRSYFRKKAATSRDIFIHMSQDSDLLSHIYDCLREVPEENRQRLFDNSVGYLLPLIWGLHTWHVTDGCRWSTMEEESFGLTLYAWSPVDGFQLIKQHGQPHHPKWTTEHDDTDQQESQQTQVVTRQDGGADSRSRATTGIRRVWSIEVHIPSAGGWTSYSAYSDCWGAPPAGQLLSPQAWSEMLGEMSRQWRIRAGYLWVEWDKSCPISVKGPLDALLLEDTQHYLKQLLVKQRGGWREVTLWKGNIDSSDLCEWTRCYTQQSVVRVVLGDLHCNISKDEGSSRQDQEAAVRALEDTVHLGRELFPKYAPLYFSC